MASTSSSSTRRFRALAWTTQTWRPDFRWFHWRRCSCAAIGFIVREATSEIGKLRNGCHFVAHVTLGANQCFVPSEA